MKLYYDFMVDYTTTMTKAGQYLNFHFFKYKQILIQRTLDQYKPNSAHTLKNENHTINSPPATHFRWIAHSPSIGFTGVVKGFMRVARKKYFPSKYYSSKYLMREMYKIENNQEFQSQKTSAIIYKTLSV